MFLCIVPCVSSSLGDSSVSKLSETDKESKVLSKKAKNPELGKLTDADKAGTGRVSRGLICSTTSKQRIRQYICTCSMWWSQPQPEPSCCPLLFRLSRLCSGPIWKPSEWFCPASVCCSSLPITWSPCSPTTGWACGLTTLWLMALSLTDWWDLGCTALSACPRVRGT